MSAVYVCSIEDGQGQARAASVGFLSRSAEGQQEARKTASPQETAKKISRNGESVHRRSKRRPPLRRVLAAMGGMSKQAWRTTDNARGEYLAVVRVQ